MDTEININQQSESREAFWLEWLKDKKPEEIAAMIVQKEEESDHDHLTGLLNKRGWDKKIKELADQVDRDGGLLLFLMADVDKFKAINDQYGHVIGDLALVFISGILETNTRGGDAVARTGGDEFGIAVKLNTSGEGEFYRQRIIKTLQQSLADMEAGDPLFEINISISIGLSERNPQESCEEAIKNADKNMYRVKRESKNG